MTDAHYHRTYLARALADGYAAIAGEGRNEWNQYLTAAPRDELRAAIRKRHQTLRADGRRSPIAAFGEFSKLAGKRIMTRSNMNQTHSPTPLLRVKAVAVALLVVVATTACIFGGEPETAAPTPDLQATIDAAIAKVAAERPASAVNDPTSASPDTAMPGPTSTIAIVKAATDRVVGAVDSPTRTLPPAATLEPMPTAISTPTPERPVVFDTLPNARYLESKNPHYAKTILELPWITDGIDVSEREAVTQLIQLAAFNERIFRLIMYRSETQEPHTLDWIHDSITGAETEALQQLGNIAHNDAAIAEKIIVLPWVGDGVTESEMVALQQFGGMVHDNAATAGQGIALSWVADDVTETEISAIGYIPYHSPAATQQTIGLPWIADGISESEIPAIRSITYHDATTVQQIIALPWVADGVSEVERLTIMGIPYHLEDVVNGENHPNQRYISEKQYMLTLINQERTKAGVPTITMGDNISAQLHAEDMLHNCYRAHKGLDGRQPLERFQDHGGETPNFGGENIIGFDECTPNTGPPNDLPRSDVADAMDAWMNSPGHRANLLTLSHCKVNIGIAWSGYTYSMVQLFESDGTYSNGPCSTRD